MTEVRLTVAARSDVGRVRSNNEDAFLVADLETGASISAGPGAKAIDVRDKGVLLAVSDGMGGHQAGEVASALVIESLRDAMRTTAADSIEAKIDAAVHRANADVALAAQSEDKVGMGATLTAVFIGGVDAYVAEVGDSRAYLLRAGRLRQITRDQSLVQMMVDKGLLSKEDAKFSPHKNVILQAMGLADDVRVAIARLHLRRGDRLLLCSDGVSNSLSDDEIRELLAAEDTSVACQSIIDRGNDRGGEDNLTAVVAQVDGAGLAPPRQAESVTATFEVIKDFADPADDRGRGAPKGTPGEASSQGPAAAGLDEGQIAGQTVRMTGAGASGATSPGRMLVVAAVILGVLAVSLLVRWLAG